MSHYNIHFGQRERDKLSMFIRLNEIQRQDEIFVKTGVLTFMNLENASARSSL